MTTSKLLINEYPLQVLPSLATAIGLNQAIVLQQVHYWLGQSTHCRDGRRWVYNTYPQWAAQFPFWHQDTVERTIRGLEASGLLISTDAYNTSPTNRTKWYTIDYDALNQVRVGEGEDSRLPSPAPQVAPVEDRNLPCSTPQPAALSTETTTENTSETPTETTTTTTAADSGGSSSSSSIRVHDIAVPAWCSVLDPAEVLHQEGFTLTRSTGDWIQAWLDAGHPPLEIIAAILNASLHNVQKIAYVDKTLANWRAEQPPPAMDGEDPNEEPPPVPPPPPARVEDGVWQWAYAAWQRELPREAFDAWLRHARLVAHEGDTFIVGVQHIYARDWLEQRLKKAMVRTLSYAAGRPVEVEFRVEGAAS